MRLLRVLGWLLIAVAVAVLSYDVCGWSAAEPLRLSALGELWFKVDRSSLNLAQAVLIVGYEWFQAGTDCPPRQLVTNETRPATKAELLNFFAHLEKELDDCGFLRHADKRPVMVRNIRNIFQRADLTEQEIRTLHGIVKELAHERVRRPRRRPAG